MALAKKIVQDFDRVYAPQPHDYEEHLENQDEKEMEDNPEEESKLHMDTCKIKHEDSAQKTSSISVSNLLGADSLENRVNDEEPQTPNNDGEPSEFESFEIIKAPLEPMLHKASSAPQPKPSLT